MPESSGKKNKTRKTTGWEEAGGEFYQENYSATDWDRFQKNTLSIATLLPSKQNRFGTNRTNRKVSKGTQQFKNTNCRQLTTNPHTSRIHNDVQSSVLPDLSQILNDEERIWEEMLHIKLVPVSMQEKKELKSNLQSTTKLRLQGFNQFKWKHRKAWKKIGLRWTALFTKLELWQSSLKQIEGYFGTGVVAYFIFLRWLFFLNCVTILLILIFLILPNLFVLNDTKDQCNTDVQQNFTRVFQDLALTSDIQKSFNILDVVQGTGIFKTSLMFYGAYSNKIIGHSRGGSLNCSEAEPEQGFYYDLPLAYVFVAVVYFFIALMAIVRAAAREFKDRLVNGKWQFYQYSNLVFGGWDYCIHNEKSASIKHKALFNEIKGLLMSKQIEYERNNRSRHDMSKLVLIRIIVNISVLILLTISAYFIYLIFNVSLNHQLKKRRLYINGTQTSLYSDEINLSQSTWSSNDIVNYLIEFLPYIAISCLNLFLPTVFNYLCKFEKYSPLFVVKISLFRTIFLRLASLAILLSRFYYVAIPQFKNPLGCWETFVGQQFFKFIITDFVSHLLVTFCINFPRAFFARNCNYKVLKFLGEQEFELSKHVLDVVYFQTICWLGSFYAPLLPAFVAIIVFCLFYIKKFQCLVNSQPSKVLYGASKSNSMFMLILLVSFFVAVVPIIYAISEIPPSLDCGPFRGLVSVWDAPIEAFMKMPQIFQDCIFFFSTAGFAIPCFVVLILLLYYFYAVSDANKNMVEVLKNQLVLEGHDKQFLLTRLSVFLKQHADLQARNIDVNQVN